MRRHAVDRGDAHEVPGHRALTEEEERNRAGQPDPVERLGDLVVESGETFAASRGDSEPDGANRPLGSRDPLDRLRGRAIRRDRHAGEDTGEDSGRDDEAEGGDDHAAVTSSQPAARESEDVPRGPHGARIRRRYAAVFERLRSLTEEHLTRLRPLIESRAERRVPCDTHGDLHLDHIYYFPNESPPRDLVIVDCIEFNDRFRFADPTADAAFVTMDLKFCGRRDLAQSFSQAYLKASGDTEAGDLWRFYTAYRAAVRAKVDGIKALEREVPDDQRQRALNRGRAHWLLALGELGSPSRCPCLILIAGLPGSGKSTLARKLCEGVDHLIVPTNEMADVLKGYGIATPATVVPTGIRLEEFVTEEPYLVARVAETPDVVHEGPELTALMRNVQQTFSRIIDETPYLPEELQMAVANIDDPSALARALVEAGIVA